MLQCKVCLFIVLFLLCWSFSAQADETANQPEEHEEHSEDHLGTMIFLGADFSPAISAEAMSVLGLHLELEFEVSPGQSIVVAGGLDAIFASSEGEKPASSVVPGFSLAYMRHLKNNIEIGGGVGVHIGIPGVETTFILGKELSNRFHGHVGLGVTWGKNSDGESDILLGPIIVGLGYRLN